MIAPLHYPMHMNPPLHVNTLNEWFQRLAPVKEFDSQSQAAQAQTTQQPVVERLLLSVSRSAMACEFEVLFNQFQYPQAADLAIEALNLVEQLESRLSVYKPRSDLSVLNRFGSQRAIPLSHDSLTLLQLAQDIHTWTDGAFDITAGSLSEAWGFSRRQGVVPSPEQIADALQRVGSQFLELDGTARQGRLLRTGVKTNPGGIGKGYALDRAAQRLDNGGIADFMIHGGLSSVVARGARQHPQTGGGWLVSLRHPWRLEQVLGTIRLRDQALGTSGSGKQFFHFGGQRYSHIIDPRSGWPAQGLLSATVICRSGAVADALATALFVMGLERARVFCESHPQVGAVLVVASERETRPHVELLNVAPDQWTELPRESAEGECTR